MLMYLSWCQRITWMKQYLIQQPKYPIVYYRNLTPRKVKASIRMYQYSVITSASLERTWHFRSARVRRIPRIVRENLHVGTVKRERKRERERMDWALVTPPLEARSKSRKEDDDNDGNEENAAIPIFAWKVTGARANPKRRRENKKSQCTRKPLSIERSASNQEKKETLGNLCYAWCSR